MLFDGQNPTEIVGAGRISVVFDELPLLPQHTYAVRMGARRADGRTFLLPTTEVGSFRVVGSAASLGYESIFADNFFPSAGARVIVPYTWVYPDGQSRRFDPSERWRGTRAPE
jgi:hypothetical protein